MPVSCFFFFFVIGQNNLTFIPFVNSTFAFKTEAEINYYYSYYKYIKN